MKTRPNKAKYKLKPFEAVRYAVIDSRKLAGGRIMLQEVNRETYLRLVERNDMPLAVPSYFYAENASAEIHLWPRPDKSYEVEIITQPWPEKQ